jgi:DNA-binding CsgD family transcriptional regulator
VALAEQAGDAEALGAALIARQFTLRGPGFLDERLAAGLAVLDIATRLGDQDLLFRAHQWLVPDRGLGRDTLTAPLSQRESEVISLLAAGRENAEVAAVLSVSVHTVERHVANIFIKIGVRNRAEATAWAHRRGLAG